MDAGGSVEVAVLVVRERTLDVRRHDLPGRQRLVSVDLDRAEVKEDYARGGLLLLHAPTLVRAQILRGRLKLLGARYVVEGIPEFLERDPQWLAAHAGAAS